MFWILKYICVCVCDDTDPTQGGYIYNECCVPQNVSLAPTQNSAMNDDDDDSGDDDSLLENYDQ